MTIGRTARALGVVFWFALAATVTPALAQQDYPNKPIHIILGFPAGGGADILARHFVRRLEQVSGKTFIVDNKPGNNGNLSMGLAAAAKPDGYTIAIGSSSNLVLGRY